MEHLKLIPSCEKNKCLVIRRNLTFRRKLHKKTLLQVQNLNCFLRKVHPIHSLMFLKPQITSKSEESNVPGRRNCVTRVVRQGEKRHMVFIILDLSIFFQNQRLRLLHQNPSCYFSNATVRNFQNVLRFCSRSGELFGQKRQKLHFFRINFYTQTRFFSKTRVSFVSLGSEPTYFQL